MARRPSSRDPSPKLPLRERLRSAAGLFRHLPGTFRLVWAANRRFAVALGALTLAAALFPPAIAWVGKLIVDAVVAASRGAGAPGRVLELVGAELLLVAGSTAVARLTDAARELLRTDLGNALNVRILEKALQLELRHFEDSDTYDKMQNARREADSRPLALVMESFAIAKNAITLGTYAAILVHLSWWSGLVIVAASIPAFVAEARLSGESYSLLSWRAPEVRQMNYLEWILTRDSHVKEVKLFDLGAHVLGKYRAVFSKFHDQDRRLARKRLAYGLGLGLLSVVAFYGCYAYVAGQAAAARISLGDMTLYVAAFRQGQAAVQGLLSSVGSMYEDALFMSNLFLYLAIPTEGERPRVLPAKAPPRGQSQQIEFRDVSFRYPGKQDWALRGVSLTLRPGEKLGLVGENGAGKSTLVTLLLRLHDPTEGAILYGGVDLRDMEPTELRSRFGAVFQDFVRYQFTAAENIGLGEVRHVEERARIAEAAEKGGARAVIESLPQKFDTVLGGWFQDGQDLSSGQWQKLAVSRAFMRNAEVLILDEPTASIDAEAEHELFGRFRALAAERTAIIISHRFSTVRIADRIAVLHGGKVVELGSHSELLERDGRYAHLFRLQAQGYLD